MEVAGPGGVGGELAIGVEPDLPGARRQHLQRGLDLLFRAFAEERAIKVGPIVHPARMAVSGKTKGAGLFEMMEVLGRERTVARMRRAANG